MRKILYLALAFLAGSILATALVNAAPVDDSCKAWVQIDDEPGGEHGQLISKEENSL